MKKRNLRPQQTAPVARETNTTNFFQERQGVCAHLESIPPFLPPFAGDSAE